MSSQPSIRGAMARDFGTCWKQLVLTDLLFKALAFVVLTPLVGLLLQAALSVSGNAVLADQDILLFLLGPAGWISFILVGAAAVSTIALEQAALLGILAAAKDRRAMDVVGALRFAARNAWPVLQVAARMVGLTLLILAPFVAAGALVYAALLTEFDINYYLKEQPLAFQVAVGIAGLLAAALAFVMLRVCANWFYALPLVLFERVAPSRTLRVSRRRAAGHRRRVLLWLGGWLLATLSLSAITTTIVIEAGDFFIPRTAGVLPLLALAIGTTLMLWFVFGAAVNLLSTTAFAVMLFAFYRIMGGGGLGFARMAAAPLSGGRPGLKLTRRRLLVSALAAVAAAAVTGTAMLATVRMEDGEVQIIAHRGSSADAPENTLAAVAQAIEDRANWVEIDVQETADGEVVVFHDSDFKKLAGLDLKIWDATMEDLRNIDIGSWFSPRFKDQRVPTLTQVLEMCRGKIGVDIELKSYGHDRQLERRVAEIVEAAGMAEHVLIMSLKPGAVKKMKALRPGWRVGLLLTVAAGDVGRIEADFLAVNARFADRGFVKSAHAAKKDVHVWTVNDAATMSTMISRGVDGLITDHPALARKVLSQRARMSPLERLLIELAGIFGVPARVVAQ